MEGSTSRCIDIKELHFALITAFQRQVGLVLVTGAGALGTCLVKEISRYQMRGLTMLEAFVIIVALGGLEIILWYLDRREQRKEIELLDSIWAELAIRNSAEEEPQVAFAEHRSHKP